MTIIHVNSHTIRKNRKNPDAAVGPISVRRTQSSPAEPAFLVAIVDAHGNELAEIRYQPEHPLSCGAAVWITTVFKAVVLR